MKEVLVILLLAWRNVFRNRRRSLLTLSAIALALASLLIFLALKRGLHDKMVQGTVTLHLGALQVQAVGYQPNLAVLAPLAEPEQVAAILRQHGVTAAPRLSSPALVLAGRRSVSVALTGVEPDLEPGVTVISRRVIAGRYLATAGELLLSRRLAAALDLHPGDTLRLMIQDGTGRPQVRDLPIGGLYETALASFDLGHVFIDIATLQRLLAAPGAITALVSGPPALARGHEQLDEALHELVEELRTQLDAARYQVVSWQEAAPDVHQLIELNDGTMRLLIGIVFVLVGLGIANTMTMSVYERFRELGVLASSGLTPTGTVMLILAEAGLLGLAAAMVGSLLGGATCFWLSLHGIDLARLTSANQYFADTHRLMAVMSSADFLLANGVTVLTALAAGILPALHAARLEPAESLRHV
ncbi:MAG: hypothetical protein BWK76_12905 [Desulfobulbaceae bacterium A2]|nr:MAG: hypothetical protein BWK76_12905 [Desulfobulbaceae bacterium A2]